MTQSAPGDINGLVSELAAIAAQNPETPEPLAVGSFAMYAAPDGGLILAINATEGPLAGTHHHKINPGMLRAIAALAGGGGALGGIKGMLGIGRSKAGKDARQ